MTPKSRSTALAKKRLGKSPTIWLALSDTPMRVRWTRAHAGNGPRSWRAIDRKVWMRLPGFGRARSNYWRRTRPLISIIAEGTHSRSVNRSRQSVPAGQGTLQRIPGRHDLLQDEPGRFVGRNAE